MRAFILLTILFISIFSTSCSKKHKARSFIKEQGFEFNEEAFFLNIKNDSLPIVDAFLTAGFDVNDRNNSGKTPLMVSCWEGKIRTVKLLLEHGAEVNPKDVKVSPLWYALRNMHNEVALLIFEKGGDPEFITSENMTVFAEAIRYSPIETIKMLIEGGANVNLAKGAEKYPIHEAVAQRDATMVKLLLNNGADPNVKNIFGETPLVYAVSFSKADIVELLINTGAKYNITDRRGRSLLDIAKQEGNKEIIEMLRVR